MPRTPRQAVQWVLDTDPSAQPSLGPDGWSQDCGRLMVRSLDLPAQGDAIDAYHLATIVGTDLYPPYGAIVYWDNGQGVGHVGVVIDNHGSVLMTDAPRADQFTGKTTAGITTVPRYLAKGTPFRYVGWSRTYGRAAITTTDAAELAAGRIETMALTPDDLTAITERLRHASWLIGPKGEAQTYEQWMQQQAQRIVGYGFRTEDTQAATHAIQKALGGGVEAASAQATAEAVVALLEARMRQRLALELVDGGAA